MRRNLLRGGGPKQVRIWFEGRRVADRQEMLRESRTKQPLRPASLPTSPSRGRLGFRARLRPGFPPPIFVLVVFSPHLGDRGGHLLLSRGLAASPLQVPVAPPSSATGLTRSINRIRQPRLAPRMKKRVEQHPRPRFYQNKGKRPASCDIDPKRSAMGSATPSPLRRVMRATEYFTLAFGCIIGVGWLVVIDEWLQA